MLNSLRRSSLLAWAAATLACAAIGHASGQTVSISLWTGNDPSTGGTWSFDSSTLTPNVYRSNDIHDVLHVWHDVRDSRRLTSTAGAPLADVGLSYFYEIYYHAYFSGLHWGSRDTHDQNVEISVTSLIGSELRGNIRISYPSADARPTPYSSTSRAVDDVVRRLEASVTDTNNDNSTSLAGTLAGGRLMHSTFAVASHGTGSTAWLTGPGGTQGQRSYLRELIDPQDPWSDYEPAEIHTDIGFTLSPLDRADFYQTRTLPNPGAVATFSAAGLMLNRRRRIESR